jgi:hypothetical protein
MLRVCGAKVIFRGNCRPPSKLRWHVSFTIHGSKIFSQVVCIASRTGVVYHHHLLLPFHFSLSAAVEKHYLISCLCGEGTLAVDREIMWISTYQCINEGGRQSGSMLICLKLLGNCLSLLSTAMCLCHVNDRRSLQLCLALYARQSDRYWTRMEPSRRRYPIHWACPLTYVFRP